MPARSGVKPLTLDVANPDFQCMHLRAFLLSFEAVQALCHLGRVANH